ncbi:MAG: hypothetical protein KDN20_19365 [Verrucomicrobiae bacterium]|nr:hypothetical protein [Verrucomicrobiae bacterium]
MPIEIQSRPSDRPEIIDRILHLVAPRGWNANTQFFLVFLAVLAVHLWVAPALMRSAADLEPGDPQGYFSSHGNEAVAPTSETSKNTPDSAESSKASVPKPLGFEEDKLVLTDSTLVAQPITESKPEEKIEENPPVLPEPASKVAPAPAVTEAPAAAVKVVADEKKAASSPVVPAVEASAESLPVAKETEKSQPRLTDLIVEAPSAPRDQAAAAPKKSAKPSSPPAKAASGGGMRQFRELR